jgi:hypothetical protein
MVSRSENIIQSIEAAIAESARLLPVGGPESASSEPAGIGFRISRMAIAYLFRDAADHSAFSLERRDVPSGMYDHQHEEDGMRVRSSDELQAR